MKSINEKVIKGMESLFFITIDASRDISDQNELIIAVRYFDQEEFRLFLKFLHEAKHRLKKIVKSLQDLFQIDGIKFSQILSYMSDNVNEMIGEVGGLPSYFKGHNRSRYSIG